MRNVGIIGLGQSHFVKSRLDVTYPELVHEGAQLALGDADLTMADIEAVVVPLAPSGRLSAVAAAPTESANAITAPP